MDSSERVVVVVQARMSSTRLPAKVLLPVGGIPVAVLAALRAGRDGLEVRLATSTDPTDDVLAAVAARHGVNVVRGPLDDTLARFARATADLAPGDLVVRLTGDNTFPDAGFVRALVGELERSGSPYLRAGPETGLPYGVGAEAFTVDLLREADAGARLPGEREHVTPWIRERLGDPWARDLRPGGWWPHLRATIDFPADYERVAAVFAEVEDAVGVGWAELCERLARRPDAPAGAFDVRVAGGVAQSELVLGTAALDDGYGVAGVALDDRAAHELLAAAVAHGVTHVDTARGYGRAEQRVGAFLAGAEVQVVTKLRPLDDAAGADAVDASVFRSLATLGLRRVDALLLHRARDAERAGGAVWERLRELREEGFIGRLGVSVATPEEALRAFELPDMAYVQLPFNLLDRRWGRVAERLAARDDVTAVARSVFLQGLLTGDVPAERWPAGADAAGLTAALGELAAELGREDRVDLCLAHARAQPWLDALVVGAVSAAQVRDLCRRLVESAPLTPEEVAHVEARLPAGADELVDPSRWSLVR